MAKIKLLHAGNGTATPPTLDEGELAINALASPTQLWTSNGTTNIDLLNETGRWLPVANPSFTGTLTGPSIQAETWPNGLLLKDSDGSIGARIGVNGTTLYISSWNLPNGSHAFVIPRQGSITTPRTFHAETLRANLLTIDFALTAQPNLFRVVKSNGLGTSLQITDTAAFFDDVAVTIRKTPDVPGLYTGDVAGDPRYDSAGHPSFVVNFTTSFTGGGPRNHELGSASMRTQLYENEGWYMEGRYRDFDSALMTASNVTGRQQQLWIGRDRATYVAGATPADVGTLITTGPGRTVGLLLDGVTGTVSVTGSLLLAADATAPAAPAEGMLWYNGTDLQFYRAGVWRVVQMV